MAVRALRSKLSEGIFTRVAKSGPSLVHVRRNFSSGPPGTKTISKMDSGNNGSSGLGTEKRSAAEGDSDRRSRFMKIADIIIMGGLVFGCVMTNLSTWRIYRNTKLLKALEEAE